MVAAPRWALPRADTVVKKPEDPRRYSVDLGRAMGALTLVGPDLGEYMGSKVELEEGENDKYLETSS